MSWSVHARVWNSRGQRKHHRCGLSGINDVPGRKYSCRNPADWQPADVGEERLREKETGWVNYAPGLHTAPDTRPTGAPVLRRVWVTNGAVSCLDPCSEQPVFRCTTNTLIKWDGTAQWLQRRFWARCPLRPVSTPDRGSKGTHVGPINNNREFSGGSLILTKMSKQQPDESVRLGDVNAGSANPALTPSFLFKINKGRRASVISQRWSIL